MPLRLREEIQEMLRGERLAVDHFAAGDMNAFTTTLFGCTPAGIIVSKEYSLGSSFRHLRF